MSPRNNTLNTRLDARLAGYAALAGIALTGAAVTNADAAIVYSGVVNVSVPSNIDGVYMNFVTGATSTTGFTGYDFNPYNNNAGLAFFSPGTGQGTVAATSTTGSAAIRLNMGDAIGAAQIFNAGQAVGTAFFTGGLGYVGIRFLNEATGVINYGWALLNVTNGNGFPATVVSYAYENTGATITAGAVPEPTTTALLGVMAAGALGVRQWRRRKAA
jgi:hypothetical protein